MSKALLKRIVFGLLFSITIILGVLYCKEAFFLVFLFILIIAMREFYMITKLAGASPLSWLGIFTGISVFSTGYMYSFFGDGYWFFFIIVELSLLLIFEIFRDTKTTILNFSALLAGIIYVAFPLTIIQYLFFSEYHSSDYNPYLVLSIFFIIWMNDSGAYMVGSSVGKHKLAPKISPNKTWEGAIGGAILSLILVLLLPQNFLPIPLIERIILAIIVVSFSTLGDLFQSKLKRSVNIKDSGKILPGHGGILDRIDSMLFAFPAVFVYLGIIGYETF